MSEQLGLKETLGALRNYLEELADTGVDGLPYGDLPAATAQAVPDRAVERPRAAAVEATALIAPPPAPEKIHPVEENLDGIRREMGECLRCELGKTRTTLVFGVGSPRARIVFVGEAPGRDEDLNGEPFVGEAGKLLTRIIEGMGLRREDVYICNVLKCRPPNNRDPKPEEVEACGDFMLRQVRAIKPEVVVALGKFAAQTLLDSKSPISALRGRFHDYHGIPLMPTFHPSALLRDASMKRPVWEDMKQVLGKLGLSVPKRGNE